MVSNKGNESQAVSNTIKMELTERQQEIQKAIASAFILAETNEEFKKQLSDCPFDVIQEFIAFKVTETEITEVFNLDNQLDYELSDLQLETVSGGSKGQSFNEFVSYIKDTFGVD